MYLRFNTIKEIFLLFVVRNPWNTISYTRLQDNSGLSSEEKQKQ